MQVIRSVCLLALVAGATPMLTAQTLLRDFNTTPPLTASDSDPGSFVPLPNGDQLFVMATLATGSELWLSDGSVAGTVLVKDVNPGYASSQIQQLTELSPGVYLFSATTTDHGWELWRTDGTPAGTFLLEDIRVGPEGSDCVDLTVFGGQAVFLADDGVHGIEPWVTDGTSAGTQLLLDVVPGPSGMSNGTSEIAALGSVGLVFSTLINLQWQLWFTDLTPSGTAPFRTFNTSYFFGPSRLTEFGGKVLFEARDGGAVDELWVTDGTQQGTSSLGVEGSFLGFQIVGALAYFRGYDSATGFELWRTDGSAVGTIRITDLMPGGGVGGDSHPWLLGQLQGQMLFLATSPAGPGLYRTNGTAAGTVLVANIGNSGPHSGADWGTAINGELWFRVINGPVQNGLYRTDATTAGTQLVTTLATGDVAVANGVVLMAGDDDSPIGNELYTTDGTAVGTQLFLDAKVSPVSLGSWPVPVGNFRDRVIVQASEAATGAEVWLTDGTPAGTTMVADLGPGSQSFHVSGIAANDHRMLMFGDNGIDDGDPWFSDGTPGGTWQLDILPANSWFRGTKPAAFGDRFVFVGRTAATGNEPWVTDGTVAGTFLLRDIHPGQSSSDLDRWFAFGDRMLFNAFDPSPGVGWSVWSTDGTQAGTVHIANSNFNGFYSGFSVARLGGLAYFTAYDPAVGRELFVTDGTYAGTSVAVDVEPGSDSSSPGHLEVAGSRLIFLANVGGATRLISSDGTPAGTFPLTVPADQMLGPYPLDATRVAFVVRGGSNQPDQLWVTDGTNAGTQLVVADLHVNASLEHARLGVDRLLYTSNDPVVGNELWSTDGTAAGTFLVADVSPASAGPRHLYRAGDKVVFVADDGVHGIELFAVDLIDTDDWVGELYGEGCPPTGGVEPEIELVGEARGSAAVPFRIDLRNGAPSSLAVFAWSDRRDSVPIPGGCTLSLGGALALATLGTDPSGATAVAIPPSPAFVGTRLNTQYFVLDPQGVGLGLFTSTRALELVVGH